MSGIRKLNTGLDADITNQAESALLSMGLNIALEAVIEQLPNKSNVKNSKERPEKQFIPLIQKLKQFESPLDYIYMANESKLNAKFSKFGTIPVRND